MNKIKKLLRKPWTHHLKSSSSDNADPADKSSSRPRSKKSLSLHRFGSSTLWTEDLTHRSSRRLDDTDHQQVSVKLLTDDTEDDVQRFEDVADDEVNRLFCAAATASNEFEDLEQGEVDQIVEAVYLAAYEQKERLAELAVKETGMGNLEGKIAKNVLASKLVYESIKDEKTVGVIRDDPELGITEVARPVGIVLACIPATNPTSTVIFKILCAIKGRNSIIICPSRTAKESACETARICHAAAVACGAPHGCIQWIEKPTRLLTRSLMKDERLSMILATGGNGLVHSAYSSGNPALGVGAGNVPVVIHPSADFKAAADCIVCSKTFDNGVVCSSEQAIICLQMNLEQVKQAFQAQGGYVVPSVDIPKLSKACVQSSGGMQRSIVGQSAEKVADLADINVPTGTKLLIAEVAKVGPDEPLSQEILAPVIALYAVPDWNRCLEVASALVRYGGQGHTVAIHSHCERSVAKFASKMDAARILVNVPTSQGAVGVATNLVPSLTLGCGSGGKNITTDNVSAKHLINVQRIARPKTTTIESQRQDDTADC